MPLNGSVSVEVWHVELQLYRVIHEFGQGKFSDGGLVLSSSQFSILPQLPPKIMLNSKVVKIDLKITISLC